MPSPIFSALSGSLGGSAPSPAPAQTPAPVVDQNFINQLTQFGNMVFPIMQGLNPQNVAMAFMAKQGISPEQAQQLINQYSAQATQIQKQLMGG